MRTLPLIPGHQAGVDKYNIGIPATYDCIQAGNFAVIDQGNENIFEAVALAFNVGQAHTIGTPGKNVQCAPVLRGQQLPVKLPVQRARRPGGSCTQQRGGHGPAQHQCQAVVIKGDQSGAKGLGPACPGGMGRQFGHGGGHQAQGNEGRYRHGDGEHQAELPKQAPRCSGQESNRNKDGNQHRSRGDDGKKHPARADNSRDTRGFAFGPTALHALQHHNGIVNNEAGSEHQGQQRQDVHREAQ